MTFLAPWLLYALPAAGVPAVVHLAARRRAAERPWGAMRFLREAADATARRRRVERWVLLAWRTLAVLLLVLGLAGPVWTAASPGDADPADRPTHTVLLLDDSLSMRATHGGGTRFAAAVADARRLLEAAGPADTFTLLGTVPPAGGGGFGRPARPRDAAAVRAALEQVGPTYRAGDPAAAVAAAANLFADPADDAGARRVVVLSDLQANEWGAAVAPLNRLAATLPVTVRPAAAGDVPANRTVKRPAVDRGPLVAGEPHAVRARVAAVGDAGRADAELYSRSGDEPGDDFTGRAAVPAGGGTVIFPLTAGAPGERRLTVRLPADALPDDDTGYAVARVRGPLRVLLVEGRPGVPERERERATFFLRRALSPEPDGPIRATVADAGDWAGRLAGTADSFAGANPLADGNPFADGGPFDAAVLADVPRVSDGEAARLHAFVRGGGGVWVVPGPGVDAENYNETLFDGPLAGVRLGAAWGELGADADGLFFASGPAAETGHPIVAPFRGPTGGGLGRDFVLRAFALEIDGGAAGGDRRVRTAWKFADGTPAAVTVEPDAAGRPPVVGGGAGRLAVWATSADDGWGGPWPALGRSFLPLAQQTVRWVAGRPASPPVVCGGPIRRSLPPGRYVEEATVTTPAGERVAVPVEGGDTLTFARTLTPGFHTLEVPGLRDGGTDGETTAVTETVAVNVPSAEGDLRPLPTDTWAGGPVRVGDDGPAVETAAPDGVGRSMLGGWLLLAAALLAAADPWAERRLG